MMNDAHTSAPSLRGVIWLFSELLKFVSKQYSSLSPAPANQCPTRQLIG